VRFRAFVFTVRLCAQKKPCKRAQAVRYAATSSAEPAKARRRFCGPPISKRAGASTDEHRGTSRVNVTVNRHGESAIARRALQLDGEFSDTVVIRFSHLSNRAVAASG
jgi:hypothetical protein